MLTTVCMLRPFKRTFFNKNIVSGHIKSGGFTLVELLVIAPMIIILLTASIYAIIEITGGALVEREKAQMTLEVENAISRIQTDVLQSDGFLATNSVTLTSPQGYNDATLNFTNINTSTNTGGDKLILRSFATTDNPSLSTRSIVRLPNSPYACGHASFNTNSPLILNVVYFVKNNSLWRRVLAPSNYATNVCAGVVPWQRPTCTPGLSGAICVTQDEEILTGISESDFSISYYPLAASHAITSGSNDQNNATRQTALTNSGAIQIKLRGSVVSAGQSVSQSFQSKISNSDRIAYTTTSYSAYRFQVTNLRNFGAANGVQYSEFQMLSGGSRIAGATAYGYGTNTPGGEGPDKANDNLTNTKILDYNKTSGYLYLVFPTAVTATGYRIATANDVIDRDPISWQIYGSNDTVGGSPGTWVLLHTVTGFATPTTRMVYLTNFAL